MMVSRKGVVHFVGSPGGGLLCCLVYVEYIFANEVGNCGLCCTVSVDGAHGLLIM